MNNVNKLAEHTKLVISPFCVVPKRATAPAPAAPVPSNSLSLSLPPSAGSRAANKMRAFGTNETMANSYASEFQLSDCCSSERARARSPGRRDWPNCIARGTQKGSLFRLANFYDKSITEADRQLASGEALRLPSLHHDSRATKIEQPQQVELPAIEGQQSTQCQRRPTQRSLANKCIILCAINQQINKRRACVCGHLFSITMRINLHLIFGHFNRTIQHSLSERSPPSREPNELEEQKKNLDNSLPHSFVCLCLSHVSINLAKRFRCVC